MDWEEPRSTSSHCGSENPLDHRVPVFPSTAVEAGNEAFSVEDAGAVLFSARFAVPQLAAAAVGTVPGGMPTVSATATSNPATRLRVRDGDGNDPAPPLRTRAETHGRPFRLPAK